MTAGGAAQHPRREPKHTVTESRPRFAEALTRQFREFMRRLTHRCPAPESRRRRAEEMGRLFRVVARKITRQAVRSVLTPLAQSIPLPGWDVLAWLRQWAECDEASSAADFYPLSDRPADFQECSSLSPQP
jgi:hypothetical protein